MKRFVCYFIALLYILSLWNAIAEEYSMWNGIHFGDTIEEVSQKCGEDLDYITDSEDYDGMPAYYRTYENKVASVTVTNSSFVFNDEGKLTDLFFVVTGHYDPVYKSYQTISNGLMEKYGVPLYQDHAVSENYPGIVTKTKAISTADYLNDERFIRSHVTDKMLASAWLIPLDDKSAVKIECVYESFTHSQQPTIEHAKTQSELGRALLTFEKEGEDFYWGYSYIDLTSYNEYMNSILDDL